MTITGKKFHFSYRKLYGAAALVLLAGILFLLINKYVHGSDAARWPEEGGYILQDGKLVVDASNLSEGYFMARVAYETEPRLKLRVLVAGETLDYDLPGTTEYIVVPLQMGSGYYEVHLYENVTGKKYAEVGCVPLSAQLSREDVAFLYPNQYVNYTIMSMAVSEADTLCAGKTPREAFDAVCNFITSDFVYDFIKALTVKPGTLPDIDGSFEKRMGVCQDLSAIMCCMLRTQGIPARLIIGYADDNYHAWVTANIDGEDIFYDPTAELSAISKVHEYSVERFY